MVFSVFIICFCVCFFLSFVLFLFFNDTATTEIYTLSLHDALPILHPPSAGRRWRSPRRNRRARSDRKSTRLNSSHVKSSYAVFCLKKKKQAQGWDIHGGDDESAGRIADADRLR